MKNGPFIRIRFVNRVFVAFIAMICLPPTSAGIDLNNSKAASTSVIGFTEPFVTIDLAASETGTLQALNVKRGQAVKAGQVLAVLDSEVLQANLAIADARAEAKSKLKAATIRRDRAKENYEKLQLALKEGFGGRRELEIAASELELSETEIKAVQDEQNINQLEVARIKAELRRRQLVSPIDGVVTKTHRDVGEFVASVDPEVVTVVDLSRLRIRFHPDSNAAAQIQPGISLDVLLMHSGQVVQTVVEFVSPVIDADSNTIQVDVLLDNSKHQFRSGRRCQLIGISRSQPPSIDHMARSPREAIQQ